MRHAQGSESARPAKRRGRAGPKVARPAGRAFQSVRGGEPGPRHCMTAQGSESAASGSGGAGSDPSGARPTRTLKCGRKDGVRPTAAQHRRPPSPRPSPSESRRRSCGSASWARKDSDGPGWQWTGTACGGGGPGRPSWLRLEPNTCDGEPPMRDQSAAKASSSSNSLSLATAADSNIAATPPRARNDPRRSIPAATSAARAWLRPSATGRPAKPSHR